MGSFFVEQGTQMDRQMFGGKLRIPAASLALFNTISIIALIPVYDRVLVPGLRYFNKQITLLQRIGELCYQGVLEEVQCIALLLVG